MDYNAKWKYERFLPKLKYLKKLISKYLNKMSKSCGNRYEPTISEVIDHYREKAKDKEETSKNHSEPD